MISKIKIGILDDESLFLEGLHNLLTSNPLFDVVLKSNNGISFLDAIDNLSSLPDVILLDLNMKPINGLEVLEILHNKRKNIKVIVLSSLYNSSMYGYMIKYGISGFLPKYSEKEELFSAIEQVYKNHYYFNKGNELLLEEHAQLKKRNQNPWNMISLTERELDVLKCICEEMSTKEIADQLFISVKTVEAHRSKIMEKIGCKNAIGMVLYAILNGIYTIKN